MTPDAAWDALSAALRNYAPPCTGHAVFTADQRTELERAVCSSICAHCPIADLCGAYAAAAKPDSGFWAGADRSPKYRRASKTTAPDGIR